MPGQGWVGSGLQSQEAGLSLPCAQTCAREFANQASGRSHDYRAHVPDFEMPTRLAWTDSSSIRSVETEILSNPTFSLGSSHRRWCSGRRAAELSATHSLEAPAGGDTSRAPMGSSAPTPLARPARNPRGLTPRSPGLPLGLPRVPSRPHVFRNPSPGRATPRPRPRF